MVIGWAGSSNTQSSIGYRPLAQTGLLNDHPEYVYTFLNISVSGWATFPNLVSKGDLATADVIVIDQSNDGADDTAECEAFLRLCSAAGQRCIWILNPAWNATTDDQIEIPANLTAIEQMRTVLNAYGATYIDGLALIQAHVAGGGHITDWFADTAHWNATGYAVVESYLDDILPTGGTIPTPLPARTYADAEDYEHDPVIVNGSAEDSRTGTWTEDGTSISSSDVGATITYSGTFRKFGIYRADATYPTVTVTIDGGDPITDFALYPNGYDIGTRGAHTVVITVTTTCKIDEFWAI
jgi:hypothetical protein